MKDIIKLVLEHPIGTIIVVWAVSKSVRGITQACESLYAEKNN